jgi:molecular chaperone DnaJ
VKGKGVVTPRAEGDLIVTVDVQVPTELNDRQRAAIEAFATATTVSPRDRLLRDAKEV